MRMNRHDGYFWLGLAPYWLRIVTIIGTLATAFPGLRRIDSVMISGTGDWSSHGPVLLAGFAYVGCALLVMVAGLALGDLLRLLLRWEAQQLTRHEIIVSPRPEGTSAPLPTSQALLESLGIAAPQPARVRVASVLHQSS